MVNRKEGSARIIFHINVQSIELLTILARRTNESEAKPVLERFLQKNNDRNINTFKQSSNTNDENLSVINNTKETGKKETPVTLLTK